MEKGANLFARDRDFGRRHQCFDPQCDLRRQIGFAVEQVGQCRPRHPEAIGRLSHGQCVGLDDFVADEQA